MKFAAAKLTFALVLLSPVYANSAPPAFEPELLAMPANPPATWLTYHLAHPGPGGTYPADPNCAIFWKGRYHLHYIYQDKFGHAFAHVSSDDMVHWKWHPTVLTKAQTGHDMFSGTAFLTKENKPAIIYHGQGSRYNQLAFPLDDNFDQWTKPTPIEAVTKTGQKSAIKYWDPDCWLNGETYYAISGGKPASLMKSTDLKHWEDLGLLLHDDYPQAALGVNKNEDISCANMFRIGNKWMLLCISHSLGCRYYLGDFKDEKYLPDFHGRMNWRGQEYFAPESLLTPDGRRVMWTWCRLPGKGIQGGVQSLPRELSLPEDGVLRIKPLKELESLRHDPKSLKNIAVPTDTQPALEGIEGDALELAVTIKPGTAKACGLRVLCDAAGKGGFPIKFEPASKVLMLDTLKVPFELKPGEDLQLRVFVDKGLVEVFANDREAALAMCGAPQGARVALFSEGGECTVEQVQGWKMKSAY